MRFQQLNLWPGDCIVNTRRRMDIAANNFANLKTSNFKEDALVLEIVDDLGASAAVHRGETATSTRQSPDGAVGQTVCRVNPVLDGTLDAAVAGPRARERNTSLETHMRHLALLALAAGAVGCASVDQTAQDAIAAPGVAYNAARRAAAPPQFAPVASPTQITGGHQQAMPPTDAVAYETPRPSSLWRAGSRSFFNDQRASRVGDILTVQIEIDDSAQVSNTSNRARAGSTSAGVSNFFGLEQAAGQVFNGAFDPANLVTARSDSTHSGTGAINRQEKVQLTVAAVIVDRLPNGNLVLAGRQEVRINGELRELTVSGIARPEDITSSNTISHTQIAEARISYGGRGQISSVQRPNIGQRVADAITPW